VRVTCSANLIPFDLITEILRQMTKLILKELVIQSYSFQYLWSTHFPQYRILKTPPVFWTREKVSDSGRLTAKIIVFYCNLYMLGDKNINLNRITANSLRFDGFWLSHACHFTVALIQYSLATQNHNFLMLTVQILQFQQIFSYCIKVTTLYITSSCTIKENVFGCDEKSKLRLCTLHFLYSFHKSSQPDCATDGLKMYPKLNMQRP
jgi:hypothetical protein